MTVAERAVITKAAYEDAAALCEQMASDMAALGLTGTLGLRREQSAWHEAAAAIRAKARAVDALLLREDPAWGEAGEAK